MAGTGGGRGGAWRRPPRTVPLCAVEAADAQEQGRGRRRETGGVGAAAPRPEDVGLPRRRLRAILCSGHADGRAGAARQFGLPFHLQSQLDLSRLETCGPRVLSRRNVRLFKGGEVRREEEEGDVWYFNTHRSSAFHSGFPFSPVLQTRLHTALPFKHFTTSATGSITLWLKRPSAGVVSVNSSPQSLWAACVPCFINQGVVFSNTLFNSSPQMLSCDGLNHLHPLTNTHMDNAVEWRCLLLTRKPNLHSWTTKTVRCSPSLTKRKMLIMCFS